MIAVDDLLGRWRAAVERTSVELEGIPDERARVRPKPGKWSVKEILGHLIDSAGNNSRRFVEAQLRPDLVFPGYEQDAWVSLQRYQDAPWPELLTWWVAANRHLMTAVAAIPSGALHQPRPVHNLDEIAWRPVPRGEAATLAYLIGDYVGHLEHHLGQVSALLRRDALGRAE